MSGCYGREIGRELIEQGDRFAALIAGGDPFA